MVSRVSMAPLPRVSGQLQSVKNGAIPTSTPTKSLLRNTKRRIEDALSSPMTDGSPIIAPAAKRARTVTFNPVVEENLFSTIPEPEIASIEDIRRNVRRALEEHTKKSGTDVRYDALKELFDGAAKAKKSENDNLRSHLLALTSCVSLIGKNCSSLVRSIMESSWVGKEEAYIKAYVGFLGHLASTQGAYVGNVLSMLVNKFLGVRLDDGMLPDCPDITRSQMLGRVHMALRYLLRLIPSASGTLSPILDSKFPLGDDTKKRHITYINNLTRILDYAPELKAHIFALITERLVKIDVQMQVDLDDVDDEVAGAIMNTYSNPALMEDSDSEEDSDSSDSDSEDELDEHQLKIKRMQDSVEKMDSILDILFELYSPYFSEPNSATSILMFDTLLSHFRNIILPTYKSRHTQFILFHFAQTSEHLIDTFAGECVDLAFKSGRPAVLKQSAAAYLACFVSRGSKVPPHVVRDVFNYIGVNLDLIRAENELTCRGPDLQRYSTFYATTQALLYIFCFRWRDLIVRDEDADIEIDEEDFTSGDLVWHAGVKELFDRTIYSKLNPLKICSPLIVDEFAKISNHLKFMYVYPLLATNKRIRLSQFTLGRGNEETGGNLRETGFGEEGDKWYQLDAYFPFDPYSLPKSRRWVDADYMSWKPVPGMKEESETEDDDEEDEDEESSSESESDDEADSEDEATQRIPSQEMRAMNGR